MDRSKLYSYSDGSRFIGKSIEEIFREIEVNNTWQEKESISGSGSTISQTKQIILEMPKLFCDFKIKSIFDIPCGDFNWFKQIDLSNLSYLGGDIVKDIIDHNNKRYKKENIRFTSFNIIEDKIDKVDLIFCRDCLVHFSISDIIKAISNVKESDAKYLMTTTFPNEEKNEDIQTGGWRPINLEKPPFNFPNPKYLLNENCTEKDGVFNDKSIALWEIEDL